MTRGLVLHPTLFHQNWILIIVMVGVLLMAVVPVVAMVLGPIMVLPFIVVVLRATRVLLVMVGAVMWRGLMMV
ncbi:hypothetical protein U6U78_11275 [Cutibacterium acnes]